MNLLYLVGAPGVGKSTTMRALTAGCDRVYRPRPLHHDLLCDRDAQPVAVELGRQRPGFPGTDTLPLNVAPTAAAWVAQRPAPLLLAEGDRLAHIGFLQAAEQAGYSINVVYLWADPTTVDGRCAARGSNQNEAWRRGRATKAGRLADWCAEQHGLLQVNTADGPPAAVAAAIRAEHPFLTVLPEGEAAA